MKGRVISKNAGLYEIESGEKIFQLKYSGKTKNLGIFVGDMVEFGQAIEKVYPRKNLQIRPPVANIDRMFIVLAPKPKPDFVLIDKIIIYCVRQNILPIIVINKSDLCKREFIEEVKKDYSCYKILLISALKNELKMLKDEIEGICVLVGQSAVGKSSIINSLFEINEKVGELSKKTERGKQTTRIVKLFKVGKDDYVADTAGFSLLDLSMVTDITENELSSYYPEFLSGRKKCKYRSCLHLNGECGVIEELKNGQISLNRYQNYVKILKEIQESVPNYKKEKL